MPLIAIAAVIGLSVIGLLRDASPAATAGAADDDEDGAAPKKKKTTKSAERAYLAADDPALKVDALGPRRFKAINVHEHVLDQAQADKLLEAMDALGVQRTCLMGTTTYTFTLAKQYGFEGWRENNDEIVRIRNAKPDRFCAFVTIDPAAPDALSSLQSWVKQGADGLKLYLGHGEAHGKGPFHVMPLDDPRMAPIYAYAEQTKLPIVFHVNLIKYLDEFTRVLQAHPNLYVDIPHFGLHKSTQARLDRLGALFDRFPNVFSDVSFGHVSFHQEGFESLAGNRERTRRFIAKYADRILFASDMVLEPTKDRAYLFDTVRSYMQLLETEQFRFFVVPQRPMYGLALPDDQLKKIYEDAPARFLQLDAQGALPKR